MKIPVAESIAGGYRFLFTYLVSVIGTLWLPYCIMAAVAVGCASMLLPPGLLQGDVSGIEFSDLFSPQAYAARLGLAITGLLTGAMVSVNLMRHALGLKRSVTLVYFSLGRAMWRMAGAMFLASLALSVMAVAFVIVAGIVSSILLAQLDLGQALMANAAMLAVLFFFFAYFAVRLLFLLPAVVVAEERIGIGRAFSLAGGNFWRIVLVILGVAAPVWIAAAAILSTTVLPDVLAAAVRLPPHPNPEEIRPFLQAVVQAVPVMFIVVLAAGVVARALLAGAVATAYKALVGSKKDIA